MDLFTLNRIAGAVLGIAIFVLIAKISADTLFEVEPLEQSAYIVEGADEAEPPAAPPASPDPEPPDIANAVAGANIDNGETVAAPCAICHNWEEGGGHLIGPNLYNVVGSEKAAATGFTYSAAFQGLGGDWSDAELFTFLEQPALFAPGTTMAFAGIASEQDRFDLIAFMRSWSADPAPLPSPMPEAADEATQAP